MICYIPSIIRINPTKDIVSIGKFRLLQNAKSKGASNIQDYRVVENHFTVLADLLVKACHNCVTVRPIILL